jgi:omega-amidase
MRIALVSLDQCWLDKDANFLRCVTLVSQARKDGCDLIVFPEMTLTGYSLDMESVAEPEDSSATLAHFGNLAKNSGLSIAFGACLFDPSTNKFRNQFCLARPDGISSAIYAKTHPFSFTGEDEVLEAGESLNCSKVGSLTFNASICYDLRFPELYSVMAAHCNAAIVIANWPVKRIGHWRALLVARAIENQFYMLGVNRIGVDGNGLTYEKSTLVVTPNGVMLDPVIASEEIDIYDIDLEEVARYRDEFPTVRDKRYSLYHKFLGEHINAK